MSLLEHTSDLPIILYVTINCYEYSIHNIRARFAFLFYSSELLNSVIFSEY